jgi:hypothetical protein
MRLRACMGGVLLVVTACAQLPERVRIDVDGRSIEVRQNGLSGELLGRWVASRDCGGGSFLELDELVSIRRIGPDEIEAIGVNGTAVRLFRCSF